MILSVRQYAFAAIVFIVALGFLLRVRGLSAQGLNEDEVNKAEAAAAYQHGDFSLNREHPMLLKSLVSVSLAGTEFWNTRVGQCCQIAQETAVRLPNAVFGSLTAVVIFALAQEFFGIGVGLIAAFVWSILPLAIAINRIGKEDTLLVFFTWLAYYFYVRAKHLSLLDASRSDVLYALAGASFGLMLASKYFPHYLGLIFLYYGLLGRRGQHYTMLGKRGYAIVFGTLVLVFLITSPVIVLPSTWKYMFHYVKEETMTHHGYLMMGHLYYNDPAHLLQGMPSYAYVLFLLIKTQLPLLLALVLGLAEAIRSRREPGYFFLLVMFVMWMVPFSFVVMKWFRYMLSLMPIVSIVAALGIVKIFSMVSRLSRGRGWLKPLVVPSLVVLIFMVPLITAAKAGPFYSLYLNPLGLGRVGYYFPHDELDDIGLREAIFEVSKQAPQGTLLGGEAPPVFRYYLRRFHREDLYNFSLSEGLTALADSTVPNPALLRASVPSTAARTVPAYAIVQEGRIYFDNISAIDAIESQQRPVGRILVEGVPAATIYRLDTSRTSVGPNHLRQKAGGHETHIAWLRTAVGLDKRSLPGL
jgi:hypothetical protein